MDEIDHSNRNKEIYVNLMLQASRSGAGPAAVAVAVAASVAAAAAEAAPPALQPGCCSPEAPPWIRACLLGIEDKLGG